MPGTLLNLIGTSILPKGYGTITGALVEIIP